MAVFTTHVDEAYLNTLSSQWLLSQLKVQAGQTKKS